MKKSHIVFLILIAATISVLVMSFGNFSTYETFASAAKEPAKQYRVVGFLVKEKGIQYDPKIDPNLYVFYVKDKSGQTSKVVYHGDKPTGIERSEQIVMTGHSDGSDFKCKGILMKCPSKYKKDQVAIGNNS